MLAYARVVLTAGSSGKALVIFFPVGVGKTTNPSAPIQQQTTHFIQNLALKRDPTQCQGSLGFSVLSFESH